MINIIIIIIIFNIFFLALDETVYASSVCLTCLINAQLSLNKYQRAWNSRNEGENS